QRCVNLAGRESFTASRVGKAVVTGKIENDRPVDAVSGRYPVTAVDVTDEIRVGIAPAEHVVVASHHGQPDVRVLLGEELLLTNIDSVIGEALLQCRGLTIENHALLDERHGDRDRRGRRGGPPTPPPPPQGGGGCRGAPCQGGGGLAGEFVGDVDSGFAEYS